MGKNGSTLLAMFSGNKRRKLYYLGKDDFYQSRNVLHSPTSFNFHREVYNNNHTTSKPIRFYGNAFGSSLKDITKVFGRPNYKQRNNLPLSTQTTVFYKLNIRGIKCILQMHLYNGQMFFAQIQLRDLNDRLKDQFVELFKMKYGLTDLKWNETIEDQNHCKIALKDDVVPKASFFSGDQEIWESITKELDEKTYRENHSHFHLRDIALRWS